MSPTLFTLSLDPLASLIRHKYNIKGIAAPVTERKISLFADDILLTVSGLRPAPPTSLKHILETEKEFGVISGYKIKWEKSEDLPLNALCHESQIAN